MEDSLRQVEKMLDEERTCDDDCMCNICIAKQQTWEAQQALTTLLNQPECETCGDTGQIGEEEFYQGRSVGWKACPDCKQPVPGELEKKAKAKWTEFEPHQNELLDYAISNLYDTCKIADRQAEEIKELQADKPCPCCGQKGCFEIHTCNKSKCEIVTELQARINRLYAKLKDIDQLETEIEQLKLEVLKLSERRINDMNYDDIALKEIKKLQDELKTAKELLQVAVCPNAMSCWKPRWKWLYGCKDSVIINPNSEPEPCQWCSMVKQALSDKPAEKP